MENIYFKILVGEEGVALGGEDGDVEVLADDDELLHAVAVDGVPVAGEAGLAEHVAFEFVGRSGGKPLAGFGDALLASGLLEEVRHVGVLLEVHNAL